MQGIRVTLAKTMFAVGVFTCVFFSVQLVVAGPRGGASTSMPLPDVTVQSECAIWFVGSSSMSRWTTLQQDMSPWSTHNRSISGATLEEITQRFRNDRQPQPPRAIVFYAGENDLAFGIPLPVVISRFQAFLNSKTERVGAVPVLFVSVKPSPARWSQHDLQGAFNQAVRTIAQSRSDLYFVDTVPQLMSGGQPGPFFGEDGLHLNDSGYHILTSAIRSALSEDLDAPVVRRCSPADLRS